MDGLDWPSSILPLFVQWWRERDVVVPRAEHLSCVVSKEVYIYGQMEDEMWVVPSLTVVGSF
jgi:hypothetical protein